MKNLSDTIVTESKGDVKSVLQNMDSKTLTSFFLEWHTQETAWEFLEWCLDSKNYSFLREMARDWLINTMLDEEISMDDLKRGGWC